MCEPVTVDAVDLLDRVAVTLERARAVTWAIADQIESALSADPLGRNLCGGVSTVYAQLLEAQDLVERLAVQVGGRSVGLALD